MVPSPKFPVDLLLPGGARCDALVGDAEAAEAADPEARVEGALRQRRVLWAHSRGAGVVPGAHLRRGDHGAMIRGIERGKGGRRGCDGDAPRGMGVVSSGIGAWWQREGPCRSPAASAPTARPQSARRGGSRPAAARALRTCRACPPASRSHRSSRRRSRRRGTGVRANARRRRRRCTQSLLLNTRIIDHES